MHVQYLHIIVSIDTTRCTDAHFLNFIETIISSVSNTLGKLLKTTTKVHNHHIYPINHDKFQLKKHIWKRIQSIT